MNSSAGITSALGAAILVFKATFESSTVAQAADTYVPFEGEKSAWHDGFARFDFVMEEETLSINPFKGARG